jgi:hypothetical protein
VTISHRSPVISRARPSGLVSPRRPRKADGFNQRGNSGQAKPNKTKQNCLDFLGFIRPNQDFSKGYAQKIKKTDSRLKLCTKRLNSSSTSHFFLARASPTPARAAGSIPRIGTYYRIFLFYARRCWAPQLRLLVSWDWRGREKQYRLIKASCPRTVGSGGCPGDPRARCAENGPSKLRGRKSLI